MRETFSFPVVASCVSVIAVIVTLVITWISGSVRLSQRLALTLMCIGVLVIGVARILGVHGVNGDRIIDIYLGLSVSALVVAIMSRRRRV
jgi:hypothetical protein